MTRPYVTDDGCYRHCPYCATPLDDEVERRRLFPYQNRQSLEREAVPCPVCGLSVTNDAPVERPPDRVERRKPCRHRGAAILADALYCHGCRKWQSEPFERA